MKKRDKLKYMERPRVLTTTETLGLEFGDIIIKHVLTVKTYYNWRRTHSYTSTMVCLSERSATLRVGLAASSTRNVCHITCILFSTVKPNLVRPVCG